MTGIKNNGGIVFGKAKNIIINEYFKSVYKADTENSVNIDNGCFNFKWDKERAISNMSKSKAVGWDRIP